MKPGTLTAGVSFLCAARVNLALSVPGQRSPLRTPHSTRITSRMSANPPKVAGDDRNGNSMACPLFLGLGCIRCGDYMSRIEFMDPGLVDD
jgi:hypothetical protein